MLVVTAAYVLLTAAIASYVRNQTAAQKRNTERDACLLVLQLMEKVRADRAFVRQYKDAVASDESRERYARSLDAVCRAFDILGILDRLALVPQSFVDSFYACPLKSLYEGHLKNFVERERETSRGKTHFWELHQLYERTKGVYSFHPALTGKDWPANPRQGK
jgi:hypothetical protein